MLARYTEEATAEAARAIAASRSFDLEHHSGAACAPQQPCRSCWYDAAAAVAATLLCLENHRLEDEDDLVVSAGRHRRR